MLSIALGLGVNSESITTYMNRDDPDSHNDCVTQSNAPQPNHLEKDSHFHFSKGKALETPTNETHVSLMCL